MCFEATRDLPLEAIDVETPVATAHCKHIAGKKLAIVPILRAGLGMVDGMVTMMPNVKVGHIGLFRDPQTLEPVPDGQWGEVVMTTLSKECSPLVRYRTRDISRIITGQCECGRTFRRMDRITGRTDDMMILRGVNVFPSQIEEEIVSFPEIVPQYQLILTTKGSLDHVELQVETVPDFPFDEVARLQKLTKDLKKALKDNLQIAVDVKIVEPKTIERSEGKAKRIIDLREGLK